MKKTVQILLTTLLLLALLFVLAIPALAADDVVSGAWGSLTWTLNQTTGELVISGKGGMKKPPQYQDTPWLKHRNDIRTVTIEPGVTSICSNAFSDCQNMTDITLSEGILTIGERAFWGCAKLETITIPKSVSKIYSQILSGCTGLTSITVAKGNSSYHVAGNCLIETHSQMLINGCNNSVIPNDGSVSVIDQYAFYGCKELAQITISHNIAHINEAAFYGCTGLTDITLGASTIQRLAFADCTGLTSLTLLAGVSVLADEAFAGCTNLSSIKIPSSLINLSDNTFLNCGGLTEITVAKANPNYKSIGNCLISNSGTLIKGCNNSVIPNDGSVKSIGDHAFSDCAELTSITIPESVVKISNSAFNGCTRLTSITVAEGNFNYRAEGNCLIEIKSGTLIKACNNSVIPIDGSVKNIGSAFAGCAELTSIVIPWGVTIIDSSAFSGCTGLTSITIPDSISNIYLWAFNNCPNLQSIHFCGSEEKWNELGVMVPAGVVVTFGHDWVNAFCSICGAEEPIGCVETISADLSVTLLAMTGLACALTLKKKKK